jgi:NADPH:quinone reductase
MTPSHMQAIVQYTYGGPEVLHFENVPVPALRPHDLLVRVRAVSVNPVDAKQRQGSSNASGVPNPPKIVGWDAAGDVVAVGTDSHMFTPGDDVFFAGDITRPGSYAEYVAVDERIVGHKPKTLSYEAAAAAPLTALTAWEALFEMMRADEGDAGTGQRICLIVGGAGGVGSNAIQIAKRVCGLTVVATASRPTSEMFCHEMGADYVINHHLPLIDELTQLGMSGADYILSTARLGNFPQLVSALNPLGKICCILGGEEAKRLDVSGLYPIRGTLAFELMFTRPSTGIGLEKQGQILNRISELLDDKTLVSTMKRVLPWSSVHEAHLAIETGHTVGKIVMRVGKGA